MYISLPDIFLLPIIYIYNEILEIKELEVNRYNLMGRFNNRYINSRQGPIGVSLPNEVQNRWAIDGRYMEMQADMLGVPLKVTIAENNANRQNEQIDEMIDQGVQVLIIAPINSKSLAPVLDRAKKAGIKIIAYDRLILDADIDAYITYSSLRVGQIQGRYLIEKAPRGNYIILFGDPADNNSSLLREGAMEYIRPRVLQRYINIVKEAPVIDWNPLNAYNIVKNALVENNNNVVAILSPNDSIANEVIRALEEQGLAGKVLVTGQDGELQAARRIVNGTQSMTVFKDSRELGKEAVDLAVKLSKGDPVDASTTVNNGRKDVPSILLTPVLVDENNLERILIDSGYLDKNQVYQRY